MARPHTLNAKEDILLQRWTHACANTHTCEKCADTLACQRLADKLVSHVSIGRSGHREPNKERSN